MFEKKDGETEDDKTGLDVELCPDRWLEPFRNTNGVGNEKTYEKGPERPLEITFESELRTDHPYDDGYGKECDEGWYVLAEFLTLKLDTGAEEDSESQHGDEAFLPEGP